MIVHVEGINAEAIREDIRNALPKGLTLANEKLFFRFFDAYNGPLPPLGRSLDSSRERRALAPKAQRSLEAAGGRAVVLAYGHKTRGGKLALSLLLVHADKAAEPVEKEIIFPDTSDSVRFEKIERIIKPALETRDVAPLAKPIAERASEPTTKPAVNATAETTAPVSQPDPPPTAHGFTNGWLVAEAALGAAGRNFSYQKPVTNNVQPYTLWAAPRLFVRGELYPLAPSQIVVLRDLGVFASYERAFLFGSTTPDDRRVDTTWYDFRVGARVRIHSGHGPSAPVIGLEGAYTKSVFSFTPGPDAVEPSVNYRAIRLGLDGRFPLGKSGQSAILLTLGHLLQPRVGELANRFPRLFLTGLDVSIGGAFPVSAFLEARLMLSYSRYSYTLHAAAGDLYQAQGAVDQYAGLRVGLALAP